MKNCCTRAVASGRVTIQKASDMVKFCCENLTVNKLSDDCYHLLRSFVQIDTVNIDRHVTSESLKTLTGSRSLHAMRPDRNQWGKIMKKQQSCFCSDCLEGRQDCKNKAFTGPWTPAAVVKTQQKKSVHSTHCKEEDSGHPDDRDQQPGASSRGSALTTTSTGQVSESLNTC